MRSPRASFIGIDKIPQMKVSLGKAAISEGTRRTDVDNEAKILAEKLRAKRDAIRTAVDGTLARKSRPSRDAPSYTSSIFSQTQSDRGEFSTLEEDDDCAGPLKAASESLVSASKLHRQPY